MIQQEQISTVGEVNEVKIIKFHEMKMVGFSVSVSFKDGDFSKIWKTKQLFMKRKDEIQHVVNPETYWAPRNNCEVIFTYFFCLQVSKLTDIPEGMIGFTIPETTYATVYYNGTHPWNPDPYDLLALFRQANNFTTKENGMVLEKYRFEKDCTPMERITLDVFGPIQLKA
jgi:effector-binding domain-containing protein